MASSKLAVKPIQVSRQHAHGLASLFGGGGTQDTSGPNVKANAAPHVPCDLFGALSSLRYLQNIALLCNIEGFSSITVHI